MAEPASTRKVLPPELSRQTVNGILALLDQEMRTQHQAVEDDFNERIKNIDFQMLTDAFYVLQKFAEAQQHRADAHKDVDKHVFDSSTLFINDHGGTIAKRVAEAVEGRMMELDKFAQSEGTAWYGKATGADGFEIHAVCSEYEFSFSVNPRNKPAWMPQSPAGPLPGPKKPPVIKIVGGSGATEARPGPNLEVPILEEKEKKSPSIGKKYSSSPQQFVAGHKEERNKAIASVGEVTVRPTTGHTRNMEEFRIFYVNNVPMIARCHKCKKPLVGTVGLERVKAHSCLSRIQQPFPSPSFIRNCCHRAVSKVTFDCLSTPPAPDLTLQPTKRPRSPASCEDDPCAEPGLAGAADGLTEKERPRKRRSTTSKIRYSQDEDGYQEPNTSSHVDERRFESPEPDDPRDGDYNP